MSVVRRLVLVIVAAAIVVSGVAGTAAGDATDVAPAQELAERYTPIVMVKAQDGPCDADGEPYEPAPVDIVLDNPEVFLRQVGNGDPVAMRAPGASDIFDLQEGSWYLDFPGDALNPRCTFETDYLRFSRDLPSVVYAHVATEVGRPGMLGLQYWFFWYHNFGKNDHEGDWEFMQLLFDVGTVEEALQTEPVAVGLAQHIGGERADWDDDRVEREGRRVVVYPAKGSHASYFNQAVYLGRTDEFFGCDNTDEPSRRVDPEVVVLPDEVTDPNDEFAWLAFNGRWGQREQGFFNGPTGPADKARWSEPVSWHEDLREASVVIPAGDRYDGVVATFCGAVEKGSLLLVKALHSPISVLAFLVVAVYLVQFFARRTTWSPVTTEPLRERRAAGQILRSAFCFFARRPLVLLGIGLVAIPVSLVTSAVQALVQEIPIVSDLISVAGSRSESGVAVALLVGSIGNAMMYVLIGGAAAVIDRPHPSRATVSQAVGPLLSAFARATAVVVGLLVTIVGIPWALRQLVRYQLIPQVVVLEGCGGKEALRRSAEVVQGRWRWTAAIVVVFQFLISSIALVFALVVLVAFPGIPLWLFNIFSSVVFELLMPLFGLVMAYVYGAHVTRHREASNAQAPAHVS